MSTTLSFDCQHRYAAGFTLNARFEGDGHLTAICGRSGSGKTTVLSLIAGLMAPDRGYIRLGDQVVTDTENRVFLRPERRRIGMLLQDHCLFPHLRVQANIAYGMRRRARRAQKGIPLERVIHTLELEDVLHRYPHTLSGGQQQRVALARAIASAPQMLLLDEPLTTVEAGLRDKIATFIERVIHEFQIPTLLVSHNRDLVDRLATRVVLIEDGRMGNGVDPPQAED